MEGSVSDHRVKIKKNLDFYHLTMRDAYESNSEVNLFGDTIRMPLGISSIVLNEVVRFNKQLEIAKGTREFNTIMTVNCCSFRAAEEIAIKEPDLIKWLEIYIFKDRTVTLDFVKRAEKLKFKAIVLTIAFPSKWRKIIKPNQFETLSNIYKINLESNYDNCNVIENEWLFDFADDVSWDDLEWLRRHTRLPIIVNGILTAEDARLAVYNGANGVMVSNYGQTNSIDILEVLSEIVAEVGKQAYVFIDDDLRTGSEVFEALAVGANAVFIRQPIIASVDRSGSKGVKSILDIYYRELNAAMNSYGCSTINEIKRAYIRDNDDDGNKRIYSKL